MLGGSAECKPINNLYHFVIKLTVDNHVYIWSHHTYGLKKLVTPLCNIIDYLWEEPADKDTFDDYMT